MAKEKLGYRRGMRHIKNLRLYAVHKNGRLYWRLRVPNPSGTGFSEGQFSVQAEALDAFGIAYREYQGHGLAAAALNARQRGDALAAFDLLPPGVSLLEAARFYSRHHQNIRESKPVALVVSELCKAKAAAGLSRRYLDDLHYRLGKFAFDFGPHKIAEISGEEIERWLRERNQSALSQNTCLARLHTLFNFAKRRRWCAENPVAGIEKAKWIGGEPGVLSPEEFARLLESASPETVPYWAIGGWCGLRSAELARLEWQDIDFARGLVEVTKGKAKTAARRHVEMRAALMAWLAPYRAQHSGKVFGPNLRWHLEADRRRAGIEHWPPNALRHSFASYHLENYKLPGELCVAMGHVDPNLVQRFYRNRVRPEAAAQWWSIMPIASEGEALPPITQLVSAA